MFRCTCGKEYDKEGWLRQHLRVYKDDPEHAEAKELIGTSKVRAVAEGMPLDIKVFVKVNGRELTLAQFTSLANRLAAVRDTLKHLGLD